jgi:hypothetical protein
MNRDWLSGPAHDQGRSLHIVRIVLAFILITHPIYALLHPANIHGFGHFLECHRVIGPGKEGIEYSTLLIACFVSILLAYWPKPDGRARKI